MTTIVAVAPDAIPVPGPVKGMPGPYPLPNDPRLFFGRQRADVTKYFHRKSASTRGSARQGRRRAWRSTHLASVSNVSIRDHDQPWITLFLTYRNALGPSAPSIYQSIDEVYMITI